MKIFFLLGLLISSSLALAGVEEFEGIARISGCSASLVRFKNQSLSEKALILTTDYCTLNHAYKMFDVDKPYKTNVRIFNKEQNYVNETFVTTKVIYATQTTTDVSLLELEVSYQYILDKHGVSPLVIDDVPAPAQSRVSVYSGFMSQTLECVVDAIVYKIVENTYISRNSYRLGGCFADMGTAGSPMVLGGTRLVSGVTSTSNFDYTECKQDTVCEISEDGQTSVHEFTSYAQQLNHLYTCLDQKSRFDLSQKGCKLFGGDSWVE